MEAKKAWDKMVIMQLTRDTTDFQEELNGVIHEWAAGGFQSTGAGVTDEQLAHVNALIAKIEEAPLAKVEDAGSKFPAAAYAYVPDTGNPETWDLRMWETPERKITKKQLGRVNAMLSPRGHGGKRVRLPAEEQAKIKATIRAAYRQIGIKDIPKWVSESAKPESHRVGVFNEFKEDAYDPQKGVARVRVIQPGFNSDKSVYYSPEGLKETCSVFEGAKMFANHPTKEENESRPVGSIKSWVANLTKVHANESGEIFGDAVITETWLKDKLSNLSEAGLLGEMGVSIRALGSGINTKIEGVKTRLCEAITHARSVDFVTTPGAGGQVMLYESAPEEFDVGLIDESDLRKQRPELVELIESAAVAAQNEKETTNMAENEKMTEQITALETKITELTTERDELKATVETAQQEAARVDVQKQVEEALSKAEGLPEPTKKRLRQQFAESTDAEAVGLAVKAELDYIGELKEAGTVKGMGETSATQEEKGMSDLVESYKQSFINQGLSPEDAERKAKERANIR